MATETLHSCEVFEGALISIFRITVSIRCLLLHLCIPHLRGYEAHGLQNRFAIFGGKIHRRCEPVAQAAAVTDQVKSHSLKKGHVHDQVTGGYDCTNQGQVKQLALLWLVIDCGSWGVS